MLSRIARAGIGAALVAAALPAVASADEVIEAQTVWRFDASSYTIDQGEPLLFRNADAASPGPHNVVADDKGPDGKPLFASKTIENGEEAPVDGARRLTTGSYGFICTVHPFMQATLVVTDKGTPQPAPGGGPPPSSGSGSGGSPPPSGGAPPPSGPAPSPAPAAAGDTRAPALRVALRGRSLRSRRLSAAVTSDEASAVRMRLTARVRGRTVTVATATTRVQPGRPAAVRLRAGRSALRALRGVRRVALTLAVEARDAAGNVGTATARRTLRR
jgi:plastocyanin